VDDLRPFLETLASHAHPDGGWGYAPEQPAHLEPTCLALLALAGEAGFESVVEQGKAALARCAQPDGSYRAENGREEAIWPTALVLFTQSALGYPRTEIERTASALLRLRGQAADASDAKEIHDIDLTLAGWPWAEGNFSWVEPTAWACLALERAGYGSHSRVEEGKRLLLDRAFDEGGVNYGNRRILGLYLEPIPTPTALLLLVFQRSLDHPRLAASVRYLLEQACASDDVEHLCWSRLALAVGRDQPGVAVALTPLRDRILAAHTTREQTPWVKRNVVREALLALALNIEKHNPFAHPEATDAHPVPEPGQAPQKKWRLGEWISTTVESITVFAMSALRQTDPKTGVHIAPVGDYNANLAEVVQRQYEAFRAKVPLKGKRVVLKPNLVEYHREKVINTHPHVVAAVIELCQREGAAEVVVAEGPGHWRNVEYLVAASGLGDVLWHYKVPFVDLNHDEPVKRPNLGRLTGLSHLYLSGTIASADVVISIPKLKTHHWAVATLSLKNLFGTLPGICYGWPKNELHWRGIDNSIVDIALTRTPDLAVVDGIVGMEGDGPLNGAPKPMGLLIMGTDLVAVDATCCRLMQLDPSRVGYLVMGARKKLGVIGEPQIEQLGETILVRAQPFATVPHFEELRMGRSA
jgi:uncharacterized protein (DUF362 family)